VLNWEQSSSSSLTSHDSSSGSDFRLDDFLRRRQTQRRCQRSRNLNSTTTSNESKKEAGTGDSKKSEEEKELIAKISNMLAAGVSLDDGMDAIMEKKQKRISNSAPSSSYHAATKPGRDMHGKIKWSWVENDKAAALKNNGDDNDDISVNATSTVEGFIDQIEHLFGESSQSEAVNRKAHRGGRIDNIDDNGDTKKDDNAKLRSAQCLDFGPERQLEGSLLPLSPEHFRSREYWQMLHKARPPSNHHEWVAPCQAVSNILLLPQYHILNPKHRIMMAGAGTSRLSILLYEAGYQHIHNVDFSSAAIQAMQEMYGGKSYSNMRWIEANLLDIEGRNSFEYYKSELLKYDAIVDKGTLESIIGGDDKQDEDYYIGHSLAMEYLKGIKQLLIKPMSSHHRPCPGSCSNIAAGEGNEKAKENENKGDYDGSKRKLGGGGKYICVTSGDRHIVLMLLRSFPQHENWRCQIYRLPPSVRMQPFILVFQQVVFLNTDDDRELLLPNRIEFNFDVNQFSLFSKKGKEGINDAFLRDEAELALGHLMSAVHTEEGLYSPVFNAFPGSRTDGGSSDLEGFDPYKPIPFRHTKCQPPRRKMMHNGNTLAQKFLIAAGIDQSEAELIPTMATGENMTFKSNTIDTLQKKRERREVDYGDDAKEGDCDDTSEEQNDSKRVQVVDTFGESARYESFNVHFLDNQTIDSDEFVLGAGAADDERHPHGFATEGESTRMNIKEEARAQQKKDQALMKALLSERGLLVGKEFQ